MIGNAEERIRELEAELAGVVAQAVELREVLAAELRGARPVVFPEGRVNELLEQIEIARQALREAQEGIAGYEPSPNAHPEGADVPEDAA